MSTEPVFLTTRTVYGSYIQNASLMGLSYTAPAYSTLNEKFNVQSGVVPANNAIPKNRYFAVGTGGLTYQTTADNFTYSLPISHQPGDAALYSHIPFIMRTVDNDLDASTRQYYALRSIINVNGTPYIAYYLKRLDMSNVVTTMTYNSVSNGVTTTVPFVPTSSNLNPTQPTINNTGVNSTNGDYLAVSSFLNLNLSASDVSEIVNCSNILYGTPYRASISEIALCAAVDQVVSATNNTGTQFNYTEALSTTIVTITTGDFGGAYSNNGINLDLNVGATEPLIGNNVITTG